MQNFRHLHVWQLAHELSLAIKLAVRSFPRSAPSDAKSQLVRAADSIVANIVEGCGAATRKEFARYLDISIKSAAEVDYRLQLARDERCLSYEAWQTMSEKVILVRKMLFRLRKAVIAADQAEDKPGRSPRTSRPSTNRPPMNHLIVDRRLIDRCLKPTTDNQ